MPATTGSVSRDGIPGPRPIDTAVGFAGSASPNAQTGWSPFGPVTSMRIREPAR